jgi:lipooligosaccharide transport system permease protein
MIRPTISRRWIYVWLRNLGVWRKLAIPSVLGNLADPMIGLLGLGYGLGAMLPAVAGGPYVAFLAAGMVASSTMYSASFEAMYSAFSRLQHQKTWEAILNAPLTIDDVILGELIWAGSKAMLSGTAMLGVAAALGLVASPMAVGALPVIVLLGLTFAAIGLVWTALATGYDFFMYYFTLVMTPMGFLSGVFFPVERLPEALQLLAYTLPLYHGVALIRPLLGGQIPTQIVLHGCVLVLYIVIGFCLSLHLARRRIMR